MILKFIIKYKTNRGREPFFVYKQTDEIVGKEDEIWTKKNKRR